MEIAIYTDFTKFTLTSLAILSAIFVISTKNAVISVFNLIVLYILVAFYLIYIGITYLGISYIVIVRHIHINIVCLIRYNQYSHLITVSELSKEENSKLNLASLSLLEVSSIIKLKYILVLLWKQTVFSKVKAELLEVNFLMLFNKKEKLIKTTYLVNLILRFTKGIFSTYIMKYAIEEKNLLLKENERILFMNMGRSISYNRYDLRMIIIPLKYREESILHKYFKTNRKGRIIAYNLYINPTMKFSTYSKIRTKYKNKNNNFHNISKLDKTYEFKKLNLGFLSKKLNLILDLHNFKYSQYNNEILFKLISNLSLLKLAFISLNSRYINSCKLRMQNDIVPILFLYNIQREIKSGKFTFLDNKINTRSNIEVYHISLKNRVIQEALSLIMEVFFEFRKNEQYNFPTLFLFKYSYNKDNLVFRFKKEFRSTE
jgi:NADH:ubiquinone oxidoreductase subunit 6 (subunit J)